MSWYNKKPGKWKYLPPDDGLGGCWSRDCVFFWMDLTRAGRKRWMLTITAPGGSPWDTIEFDASNLLNAKAWADAVARVELQRAAVAIR